MARSKLDSARMQNMTKGPGMDTRVWLERAKITDIGYDAAHGIFVEVTCPATGSKDTAYLGTTHADVNGGLYTPVDLGDMVLIAYPNGESDAGPVIICRYWSDKLTPPPEAQDITDTDTATKDVVWRVRKGQKWRLLDTDGAVEVTCDGKGNILLETTGTGTTTVNSKTKVVVTSPAVELGNANPVDFVARSPATVVFLTGLQSSLAALNEAVIKFGGLCAPTTIVGAGTTLAAACTALTNVIGALSAAQVPSVTTKTT